MFPGPTPPSTAMVAREPDLRIISDSRARRGVGRDEVLDHPDECPMCHLSITLTS